MAEENYFRDYMPRTDNLLINKLNHDLMSANGMTKDLRKMVELHGRKSIF
ncbi:hypothetical protein GN278_02000 [Rhodobacteraceae bacterium Araon29]